jgi:dTDP-4-dehydrorhamnose 3,5-epimerase
MNIIKTKLPGALILEPKVFPDDRGYFLETWNSKRYEQAGIPIGFVQDNISFSKKGILRGLHFQYPQSQGKLIQVLSGEVLDVVVDISVDSPTYGQWIGEILSESNHRQMYIPPGFAHGYCVTSETALSGTIRISESNGQQTGRCSHPKMSPTPYSKTYRQNIFRSSGESDNGRRH